jgi:hypothetical protein
MLYNERCAGGKSCAELNAQYVSSVCARSLPARVAAAKVQLLIDNDEGKAAAHITGCDLSTLRHTVADAAEAYRWLQKHAASAEGVEAFFRAAQTIHRWSGVFSGKDRLPLTAAGLAESFKTLSIANGSDADAEAIKLGPAAEVEGCASGAMDQGGAVGVKGS